MVLRWTRCSQAVVQIENLPAGGLRLTALSRLLAQPCMSGENPKHAFYPVNRKQQDTERAVAEIQKTSFCEINSLKLLPGKRTTWALKFSDGATAEEQCMLNPAEARR